MTLLFMDGFDQYSLGILPSSRWTTVFGSCNVQSAGGPHGTNKLNIINGTDYCHKTIASNEDILIAQFSFKVTSIASLSSWPFFAFYDAATEQVSFKINEGKIRAYRGATLLGESSIVNIVANVWHYFEIKVTFSQTVGTVLVNIDGAESLNLSGLDTSQTANEYANKIRLLGSYECYYDDIILMNDAGSYNNDFVGLVKIETLRPDGAGNTTQFAPSAGSNYENVDDDPGNDGDATYNDGDNGEKDTFSMEDLVTASGSVLAVQTILVERKTDAGSVEHRPVLRSGVTDYGQTNVSLSDSFVSNTEIIEEDPDTSTAWLIAGVNAVELGYERTT